MDGIRKNDFPFWNMNDQSQNFLSGNSFTQGYCKALRLPPAVYIYISKHQEQLMVQGAD